MVTADEIENAPNRETLTKLRGTLRSSRTRKMNGATSSNDATHKPYCLIGRDLIDHWRIVCHRVSGAWIDGRLVFGSDLLPGAQAGETIQVISDIPLDNQLFYGGDATTARVDSSQFTLLPPSSVLTKPVVIRLPPRTETSLFEIWNSIAAKGWLDSSSGGSYRTRIRRLLPSERLDVPGQVYVAGLYLPALSVPRVAVGDYVLAMYRRLSSALQQSYAELVGDFVNKGFWAEAPPSNGGQSPSVPAANVFLVTNKSSSQPPSKSRLVCDLRPINSALPIAAVHGGPGLADVLCSIRMTAPMALATADCQLDS